MDKKEDSENKTTSLSSESTDAQYPSAKAVYDALRETESALPSISVSEISGGHAVTVNGKNTSNIFNVYDGKTPVRGTDYWTADDKAYIKSYVDDAVLGGKW